MDDVTYFIGLDNEGISFYYKDIDKCSFCILEKVMSDAKNYILDREYNC